MSDHSQIEKIAERLKSATLKLHQLSPGVGQARQIREYNSDQRKQALAVEMVKSLKAGESATAADAIARASDGYAAKLTTLSQELADAERVIAEWDATKASYEAARSLLSWQKDLHHELNH